MEARNPKEEAGNRPEEAATTPKGADGEHTAEAYASASEDIAHDPDFAPPGKNDDLDEGESARLGDDGAGLA